jgi:type I restriction enzyme S subunit
MSILEAQLPNNWTWQQVSDLYRITKKPRDTHFNEHEVIPFVPMELVPTNGKEHVRFEMREPAQITSGTYFEMGDILLSKITPSFENGKQGLANSIPATFGVASTEVIPLQRITSEVNSRLLFYYLLHPEVRNSIAGKMEGSTGRQRVPERVVLEYPLPNPPREEQDKIVAVLWKVQRAIEVEEKLTATARELKLAAMRQLFTRGLRGETQQETEIGPMPESWNPRTIFELCEIWSGGTPRKSIAEYWSGNVPWVSGKDLKSPSLDDAIDHISVAGVESACRLAPQGAVLLLVRGMGLAKDLPVAVINRPMTFNQDVKALVPRGEYSGQFLRSAIYAGKERLLSRIVPSAHGTMTLNLDDVENFKVACPSDPNEATEIVAIFDALDRKISLHERKRLTLKELFKTLLHKLMTGEIRVADLDIDVSEVTQ